MADWLRTESLNAAALPATRKSIRAGEQAYEPNGTGMTDFALTKARFQLPAGLVYLDGNSLGPLPVRAIAAAERVIAEEWGGLLIRAWNEAGWITQPRRVGDRIAQLIGADPGTVVVGDTLSIKVYQARRPPCISPQRRVVLV